MASPQGARVLRVVGPVLLALGVLCFGYVLVRFVQAATEPAPVLTNDPAFGVTPAIFLGILLLGGGFQATWWAYLGPASRYVARETAPALEVSARAAREGWTEDARPQGSGPACAACGRVARPGAQFCDRCGAAV